MDFLELAKKRESCRSYLDKPVEREKMDRCIEAARMAPSACNSQPWRFVVVDDRELAAKLGVLLQDKVLSMNLFATQVPAFAVLIEGEAKLSAKIGGLVKQQEYAQIDVGISAENFCLAAAEQGLGSCMMGWFEEKGVKELLGIPKSMRIRLVIAVGYPTNEVPREKRRKSMEEIVSYNKF